MRFVRPITEEPSLVESSEHTEELSTELHHNSYARKCARYQKLWGSYCPKQPDADRAHEQTH